MSLILEISISASLIAVIIIAIRKIIQNKVSYKIVYGLWVILLIQLLIPYHIPSGLSIFNYIEVPSIQIGEENSDVEVVPVENNTILLNESTESYSNLESEDIVSEPISQRVQLDSNVEDIIVQQQDILLNMENGIDTVKDPIETVVVSNSEVIIEGKLVSVFKILQIVWVSIAIVLGAILLIMQFMLSRKLNEAILYIEHKAIIDGVKTRIHFKRNIKIFTAVDINTPLVYGIIRPRVILPERFVNQCSIGELEHVLTHEFVHIKRFDYMIKPITLVLLVLHWFNPILWISYFLVQKDMEVSCDEIVVNSFDEDIRKDYAISLVNLAENQNRIKGTITLAFGENNIKSRVNGIMSSKNRIKWITALVIICLIPLAIILLTGKSSNSDSKDSEVDNEASSAVGIIEDVSVDVTAIDNDIVDVTEADAIGIQGFNEQLDILINQVKLGNSEESILEDYGEAYEFTINTGADGIVLLDERLDMVRVSIESKHAILSDDIREKQCIDWLMSEIIRNQAEDSAHIRDEYSFTIISSDIGYGRIAPSLEAQVVMEIPKDTVIHITGFYDGEWMLGQVVVPSSQDSNESSENFMATDLVEFWILEDDFIRGTTWYNDIWNQFDSGTIALTYAGDFDYMLNSVETDTLYVTPSFDDSYELIPIYSLPNDTSSVIGYVDDNNLVTVKRDDDNQEIRQNGWALIGQMEQGYDSSTIGWLQESLIEPITSASKPNQGFILRGTEGYENLDRTSSPEFEKFYHSLLGFSAIQPVYVLNRENGWVQFVDSGYTVSGWVRESDMIYQMTEEVEMAIYHPEYDFSLFVENMGSEVLNNEAFRINALDVGKTKVLTDAERMSLLYSLTDISSYTEWEGGITPGREAAYPYYSLDFGNYSMVITEDDQLLLQMDSNWQYAYGIGTEGPTVRWVKPNSEFIEMVKALLYEAPVEDLTDYNYLFNADSVNIYGVDDNLRAQTDEHVQVNKCLRAIRAAIGVEIVIDDPDEGITDEFRFEFVFSNDSEVEIISVVHTNRYILWNGIYYETLDTPHNIQAGLFAGYF